MEEDLEEEDLRAEDLGGTDFGTLGREPLEGGALGEELLGEPLNKPE